MGWVPKAKSQVVSSRARRTSSSAVFAATRLWLCRRASSPCWVLMAASSSVDAVTSSLRRRLAVRAVSRAWVRRCAVMEKRSGMVDEITIGKFRKRRQTFKTAN